MDISSIVVGFFLKKEIKGRHNFYHELKKNTKFKFKDNFFFPESAELSQIDTIPDFPLIDASTKELNLKISKSKILLEIKGENKTTLEKFLKKKGGLIKVFSDFIKKENKIIRVGMIAKIFVSKQAPMDSISKYINLKEFGHKKITSSNITVEYIEKVGKISSNHIINLHSVEGKRNKVAVKGLVVNIDINNIKSCKLKEDELDDYLELLKKKLIDISEERK